MTEVNIYTQTSFKGPRKQDGAVTFILETETGKGPATLQKTLILQNETANRAELRALIEAVKHMRKKCRIKVYTDSRYVAAGYTAGWIKRWKENEWKTTAGKEVKNAEDWKELDQLTEGQELEFNVGQSHQYRQWMKREVEEKKRHWEEEQDAE